ncbi:MAG: exosortase-associated EpsI family protein [Chloroflexi bacterium]|nr:exosortase-associated EpsI family protein [Chloroflexota bacterium]
MDTITRRILITSALLLFTLAVTLSPRLLGTENPADIEPGRYIFTLDRGGLLRFNNGKIDVESAIDFNINNGPLQVPRLIENWEGVDFPLNVEAFASLVPELLVNRAYRTSRNETVFLTIIGSDTSRKLHRPEVCYRAADWALTQMSPYNVMLDSGQVGLGRIFARSSTYNEQRVILYWYLWRDDRRRIEDGALVMQVATPVASNQSIDEALTVSERFIRQLLRRTVRSNGLELRLPFAW